MLSLFNPRGNFQAFGELVLLLTRYRQLTWVMAKREITERYSGQLFGTLWTIGHPLTLIILYIFVFGFVFRMRMGGTVNLPFDYTTYMLSGLIPWLAFQESMSKASTVIISNANVVKQVIFPIEVLPVKGVLATLVTEVIFFGLLTLYVLSIHHSLLWSWILLPLLFLLQALAMIGVSYILAAVGAYFRDIKDIVQVFSTVAFFLMPMIYLPEAIPSAVRVVLYLNPFSYMVWCYQDILFFGQWEHPWAWLVFIGTSLGVFVLGYRLFRKLKIMFGNVL